MLYNFKHILNTASTLFCALCIICAILWPTNFNILSFLLQYDNRFCVSQHLHTVGRYINRFSACFFTGVQTPPSSIFAVSSCGASSDGSRTLGCVTSGFSPAETLTFSWTGDVTGKVDYPAMQSSGAYTAVSQVQVKNSDWEAQKSFTCQVQHPALSGAKTATMKRPGTFTWQLINPPSAKDLFVQNKAIITCVITGDDKKEVEAATVLWTVGGQTRASTATDNVKETTAPFTKSSNLTLDESEWFKGYEVKCSTERDKTPFSEKIKVEKGGKISCLNVLDSDKVSLLCEVSSSKLGDVYIMCLKSKGLSHANFDQQKELKQKNRSPDPGLYMDCVKDITGEDDYNSLWSTASSFIFLFLFTIVYSTVLSLSKVKTLYVPGWANTPLYTNIQWYEKVWTPAYFCLKNYCTLSVNPITFISLLKYHYFHLFIYFHVIYFTGTADLNN
uniref:Ig-like domain-containing protein n=1 Tax=Astyanax mexicanus TaxID=7994 RepID=A0A8B9JZB2_ASTMX